ncbi:hypothetical protein CVV38_04230 [Candidatus Peregrinibacteria bacterium HGW-Peregrinibacteria-1]|jgi:hypothetical protein|nr:MAG: hypothetical protein CVV38_04230 [Candidatus Peregrinibacteria bacterium HGW-Peregrinibacteria-1]
MKFNFCKKDGSALVVALLVMGVLMAISMILSVLILRETGLTRRMVDSGQAYYAAEAGVEEALYLLDRRLPGYEIDQKSVGVLPAGYVFSIKNQCNAYPCFDPQDYDLSDVPEEKLYDFLELNETLTLPMFAVDVDDNGNEVVVPVENFTVEFFTKFNPATDLDIDVGMLSGWDVLRWKLFGMKEVDGRLVTNSIHDFTAVSSLQNRSTGEEFSSDAMSPSWFGTTDCSESILQDDRISDRIRCNVYVYHRPLSDGGSLNCQQTEARDHYVYSGGELISKSSCYSIKNFIDDHVGLDATGLNYLTLTNLMNPDVLSVKKYPTLEARMRAARIYFRVETYDKNTVREFAEISVDGEKGGIRQSIDVVVGRDSHAPVFNFSLYSTNEG